MSSYGTSEVDVRTTGERQRRIVPRVKISREEQSRRKRKTEREREREREGSPSKLMGARERNDALYMCSFQIDQIL